MQTKQTNNSTTESPASEAAGMSRASKTILKVTGVLLALFITAGVTLYVKVHRYMQSHPGSDPTLNDVFGRNSAEVSAASQEATEAEQREKAHKVFATMRAIAVQNADTPEKLDAIKQIDELDRMLDDPKKLREHVQAIEQQSAQAERFEQAQAWREVRAMQMARDSVNAPAAPEPKSANAPKPVIQESEAEQSSEKRAEFERQMVKAKAGEAGAMGLVGLAYCTGDGVEKNSAEAFRWVMKGALSGNADAQCVLAKFYRDGYLVTRDAKQSYMWAFHAHLSAQWLINYANRHPNSDPSVQENARATDGFSLTAMSSVESELSEVEIGAAKIQAHESFEQVVRRVHDSAATVTTTTSALPTLGVEKPAVRELAPAGVVYLLVRTRVDTDSGILSLPPGTGLKLVRPGVYTDGIREMPLSADAVTNDVETARAAKRDDAAKQVVIAPRVVMPEAEPKPTRRTPAVRSKPDAQASGALGVSGGLDMDRTNKLGHK